MSTARNAFAVVTGASSGLGRELAMRCARAGFRPILIARRVDELQQTAEQIAGEMGFSDWARDPVLLPADLMQDVKSIAVQIQAVCRDTGLIGMLINNAGVAVHGLFEQAEPDALRMQLEVNLTAAVLLTRSLLPLLQSGSRIVNIASTAGLSPGPGMAVYYASKAGLVSWSRALEAELRYRGIGVTTFCPGPLQTGFVAKAGVTERGYLRRAPGPEDAAEAVMRRAMGRGGMYIYPAGFRLLAFLQRLVPQGLSIALVAREQQRRGIDFTSDTERERDI
ncbi:MAG: SDR family NAD(P)-dependent oxidoreductase [Spirochaeta sp.]